MKTLLLVLLMLTPVRHKPAPTEPTPAMPSIEYDRNCMSYWRATYDGEQIVGKTWIEPNWHELSETGKRRCQLFV